MLSGFVVGDRGLSAAGDSHPLWMMAHAIAGPFLIVGASAIGQMHFQAESPRDDAFLIRSAGPWLAIAVADGVGSRPLSRFGATYVVESLTSVLLRPFVTIAKPETTERRSGKHPDAEWKLAPLNKAEEYDFNIGMVDGKGTGPGEQFWDAVPERLRSMLPVASGLQDWTGRVTRVERRPASGFTEAASVGWWPPQNASRQGPLQAATAANPKNPPNPGPPVAPAGPNPDLAAVMKDAFDKTHLGLQDHARRLGLELGDLSCTALALLFNTETERGVACQIGDGAMMGLHANGKVNELLEAPDTGDPQSTYTLNKSNYRDYMRVQLVESLPSDPYQVFFIMTDGLSGDLLYSPAEDALKNWAESVNANLLHSSSPAQAAQGMLNWLATYVVKGSWDDRTLVVTTRMEKQDAVHQSDAGQPKPAQPTNG